MPKFLPQKTKLQPLLLSKDLKLNQIKIKIAQLQNKLKNRTSRTYRRKQ